MRAIIYSSNTGFTEQYAKMLSEEINLPAYPLKTADNVESGASIIYMGWICAGTVNGYKDAVKRYNIKAVCGVGMGKSGSQIEDIKKNGAIAQPVFTLQGGFYLDKLRGMYHFMMATLAKSSVKKLAQKPDKTEEELDMLDLMQNGGSRVKIENLAPVIEWYKANS